MNTVARTLSSSTSLLATFQRFPFKAGRSYKNSCNKCDNINSPRGDLTFAIVDFSQPHHCRIQQRERIVTVTAVRVVLRAKPPVRFIPSWITYAAGTKQVRDLRFAGARIVKRRPIRVNVTPTAEKTSIAGTSGRTWVRTEGFDRMEISREIPLPNAMNSHTAS